MHSERYLPNHGDAHCRITKAREMVELFQRYQKSHNHSEVESYCAPSPLSPSATEDPGLLKFAIFTYPDTVRAFSYRMETAILLSVLFIVSNVDHTLVLIKP